MHNIRVISRQIAILPKVAFDVIFPYVIHFGQEAYIVLLNISIFFSAVEFESNECVYYDYKDECHKSIDGCPRKTISCPKRLGSHRRCFTMWEGNEKRLQGCWASSGQICLPQCVESSETILSDRALHFCCCSGDNCNEFYGVGNEIPMQMY